MVYKRCTNLSKPILRADSYNAMAFQDLELDSAKNVISVKTLFTAPPLNVLLPVTSLLFGTHSLVHHPMLFV